VQNGYKLLFFLPPDFLRGKGIRMSDSRRLGLLRFLGATKQSWNKAIQKVSRFYHKRQFMETLTFLRKRLLIWIRGKVKCRKSAFQKLPSMVYCTMIGLMHNYNWLVVLTGIFFTEGRELFALDKFPILDVFVA